MTPTTLAETIMRDVQPTNHYEDEYYKAVLAALTAALDPALSERAGEVLERLEIIDPYEEPGRAWDAESDAIDLITAILAQNAALRAGVEQRDAAIDKMLNHCEATEERAEAAEAERDALRAERDAAVALADSKFDPQVAQDMILDAVPHAKELVLATDAENRDLQTRLTAAEAERDALRALLDKTAATLKRTEDDRVQKIAQIAALTARVEGLTGLLREAQLMVSSATYAGAVWHHNTSAALSATEASHE